MQKYLSEVKREKEITITDFKCLLKHMNTNECLEFEINDVRYEFKDGHATFSHGPDTWHHVFLSKIGNEVVGPDDHIKLVKDYIRGHRVLIPELYAVSRVPNKPKLKVTI